MNEHLPVIHQQQGGMSLADFASLHGLNAIQAQRLAKEGRILGAQRTHSGYWLVFPPAKILEGIRSHVRRNRPAPFDDSRVKEAHRILSLTASKLPFSVLLTGAQLLAIERALIKECESIKQQRQDDDDFEQDSRASYGDKLQSAFAALHVIREAARQGSQP